MSIVFPLDITGISLVISIAAIIIVIILFDLIRRQLRLIMKAEANDSDAAILINEFLSREKKLEERLVDQKVRLEILELRMQRQPRSAHGILVGKTETKSNGIDDLSDQQMNSLAYTRIASQYTTNSVVENKERPEFFKRLDRTLQADDRRLESVSVESNSAGKRDRVINEILEAVYEKQGLATAREIQARIGRSREHTARMMNLLYKQGLVSRNIGSRPFTYSLTEAGQRELNP